MRIPFSQLESLFGHIPALLHHFHKIMGNEITRDLGNMRLLGNMRGEQRFAAFLIDLSSRYDVLGYSPSSFALRMSRTDIGNYLGMTRESMSRLFSHFTAQHLIAVEKRELHILDLKKLKEMAIHGELPLLPNRGTRALKIKVSLSDSEERQT